MRDTCVGSVGPRPNSAAAVLATSRPPSRSTSLLVEQPETPVSSQTQQRSQQQWTVLAACTIRRPESRPRAVFVNLPGRAPRGIRGKGTERRPGSMRQDLGGRGWHWSRLRKIQPRIWNAYLVYSLRDISPITLLLPSVDSEKGGGDGDGLLCSYRRPWAPCLRRWVQARTGSRTNRTTGRRRTSHVKQTKTAAS